MPGHSIIRETKTGPFSSALAVLLTVFLAACVSHDLPGTVDCAATDLVVELAARSHPTDCERDDGTIEVSANGGKPPYQFRLGTGPFGRRSFFSELSAGAFIITVKDALGCEKQLPDIILVAPNGPVAGASTVSPQTNCVDPDGSIAVHVTGGVLPYQYKIDTGNFGSAAIFSDLSAGVYTITVKDAAGCIMEIDETIGSNTSVRYRADIKPILEANCIRSGCHNGDNGGDRNWNIFANVQAKAAGIRARTATRSMPPGDATLSQDEIDLIACWVNEGALNN